MGNLSVLFDSNCFNLINIFNAQTVYCEKKATEYLSENDKFDMIFDFKMTHCLYFFSIIVVSFLLFLSIVVSTYICMRRNSHESEDILVSESGQHIVQAVPIENIPFHMPVGEVLTYSRNEELL